MSEQGPQHDLDRDLSEAEARLARRVAVVAHSAAKGLSKALAWVSNTVRSLS
jgi:streptomycin 6-kinase